MRLREVILVLLLLSPPIVSAVRPVATVPDSAAAGENLESHDAWLGKDKMDHLTASAFLLGTQYYLLHGELNQPPARSLQIAAASTLALGVAKEVYDALSKRGTPSGKDLAADVLGIALAVLLLHQ